MNNTFISPIPKIIFIVPYRDREQHKCVFERNMTHIMEDYNTDDYKIFFSEQPQDNRPFNRGAVKNLGFLAMKNLYPNHYKDITFVFNDIDCFPYKKNLLDYKTKKGVVKHFFGFEHVLGGIFSITGSDFEEILGFPNFWTWGYEDNMIYNKARLHPKIVVDRSTFFPIFDHNIVHLADSLNKQINVNQTGSSKQEQQLNNLRSLTNFDYKIVNNIIKIRNFEVKLPYKDNVKLYNLSLRDNIVKVKQNYHKQKGKMSMRMTRK